MFIICYGDCAGDDYAYADYSFAFNDPQHSDRILTLLIEGGDSDVDTKRSHISSSIVADQSPFFYKVISTNC